MAAAMWLPTMPMIAAPAGAPVAREPVLPPNRQPNSAPTHVPVSSLGPVPVSGSAAQAASARTATSNAVPGLSMIFLRPPAGLARRVLKGEDSGETPIARLLRGGKWRLHGCKGLRTRGPIAQADLCLLVFTPTNEIAGAGAGSHETQHRPHSHHPRRQPAAPARLAGVGACALARRTHRRGGLPGP